MSGALVLSAVPVVAQANRHYEIKAGSVEMTNSMSEGMTQTLYFDDFGGKNATVTKSHGVVLGKPFDTESWVIHADGYVIRYDAVKKTGTRTKLLGAAAAASTAGIGGMDPQKRAASAQASKKDLPA